MESFPRKEWKQETCSAFNDSIKSDGIAHERGNYEYINQDKKFIK